MINQKTCSWSFLLLLVVTFSTPRVSAATEVTHIDLLTQWRVVPSGLSRVPDRVESVTLSRNDHLPDGGPWALSPQAVQTVFLVAQRFPEFCWAESKVVDVTRYKGNEYLLTFQPVVLWVTGSRAEVSSATVADLLHSIGAWFGSAGGRFNMSRQQAEILRGATVVVRDASIVVGKSLEFGGYDIGLIFSAAVTNR